MKRFTAFILFIIMLFISMTLLGIYLKNKFTQNSTSILNVNIDLYKYKYGKDETDNHPYKIIILSKSSEIKEFSEVLKNLDEITYDENSTLKSYNCIIKINYQRSTQNDLLSETYDVWYDETNQTPLILRKDGHYYQLPMEFSSTVYKIVNEK